MAGRWLKHVITRVAKPTCSHCHAEISPDDIDIQHGVMWCQACKRRSFVGDGEKPDTVAQAMAGWAPDQETVPLPAKAKTRVRESGHRIDLVRRVGSIRVGVFLTLWLICWSAGCVFLVRQAVREPSAQTVLFATPFVASWFFVCCIAVNVFLGGERLSIGPDGVNYEWTAIVTLGRRQVALNDVREIGMFTTPRGSDTGQRQYGLKIRTADKDIRFGKGLSREELLWLADLIRQRLHTLDPGVLARSDEKPGPEREPIEVLQPTYPPHERPPDSRIRLEREFNRTCFSRQGLGATIGDLGWITFINLFWNGVLGVLVLQFVGDFQWWAFLPLLFIIPHASIGLLLVGAWLLCLTSSLWRAEWVFTPAEATCRFALLGIGPRRTAGLTRLARLELRRLTKKKRLLRRDHEDEEEDSLSSLALVGEDSRDVMEIKKLTENEARWIADELFADFRQWFIKVG